MSEENKQEKEKTNTVIKIINTIACIGIVVSVCINVSQYKESNTLKSQIAALESEIKTLETENDTLDKEIESKKTEESDLSLQIEDLQKKLEQLEADNKGLSGSLMDLEERQKEEAAGKTNTSDTVESDNKVEVSKPSSNGGGNNGSGNTSSGSNGNTNAKAQEILKQLGAGDASQEWKDAAPAPEFGTGDYSGGEGIHAE